MKRRQGFADRHGPDSDMARVDLVRRAGEGGTSVLLEEGDRRLTVSESFAGLRVLVADEDGVEGKDESAGGVDSVLYREGEGDGGEGTEQVYPDEVDGRDESGEDSLAASGDGVGELRRFAQIL